MHQRLGLAWVGGMISRSWPRLCTPVDIRWKKPQKVSLCLTFRPARRDFPTCRDSIGKSFHAKQIGPDTWCFPSEQNTMWDVGPEILISISLIVHYLEGSRAVVSGPWKKTWRKNHETQLALPGVTLKQPKNRPLGTMPDYLSMLTSERVL